MYHSKLLTLTEQINCVTATQISFPVVLQRATVREEVHWISLACKLLETRLLQVGSMHCTKMSCVSSLCACLHDSAL